MLRAVPWLLVLSLSLLFIATSVREKDERVLTLTQIKTLQFKLDNQAHTILQQSGQIIHVNGALDSCRSLVDDYRLALSPHPIADTKRP